MDMAMVRKATYFTKNIPHNLTNIKNLNRKKHNPGSNYLCETDKYKEEHQLGGNQNHDFN